jgi:hypothetical protein
MERFFNLKEKPMKVSIAVSLILAALISGCSTHERVVERERPVVTTERVIETPVPAAAGSTLAACTWASQSYSHGAMSCQNGAQYRCDNGAWARTLSSC